MAVIEEFVRLIQRKKEEALLWATQDTAHEHAVLIALSIALLVWAAYAVYRKGLGIADLKRAAIGELHGWRHSIAKEAPRALRGILIGTACLFGIPILIALLAAAFGII